MWSKPWLWQELFMHLITCYLLFKSTNREMGSNPNITQKYKMGDISKGLADTL
jgi:hypothetical protein